MSNRTMTIDYGGRTFYGQVATVDSTLLGLEGHGLWTTMLRCSGDGWGVHVGGYRADMAFVKAFTCAVGVESWEDIPGRQVIVLFDRDGAGRALGIAHVTDENRVMILQDIADEVSGKQS